MRPGQEEVPAQPGKRQDNNDEGCLPLDGREFHRCVRYFRRQIGRSQKGAGACGCSLPGPPDALVALLAETPVTRAPEWRAGHAFELIADLFEHYVMPPGTAAQLYRALAAISGVTADVHAIDVAGRYGTGFLLAGTGAGGNQEIIVNPRTCQFRGYQFLGNGRDIHAGGAWGMAILRQALVSAPGVRPPGQPEPSNP